MALVKPESQVLGIQSVTTNSTPSFLEKKIRRIPRKGKLGVMGDKNRWKRVHHLYSVIPSVNQFIQMIHRGIAM